MIKIRLDRQGKKNNPFYRIVAIDSKKKRGGKALEVLGTYNPITKLFKIDKEKLDHWVSLGASINQSVKKLINS